MRAAAARVPRVTSPSPAVLAALGACGSDGGSSFVSPEVAATLSLYDDTLGFGSRTSTFILVHGHDVTLRIAGNPGERARLLASLTPPPSPAPEVGGVPLAVDPARFLVLLDATVPANALVTTAFAVPTTAAPGDRLYLQAVLEDGSANGARLTPGLALTVVERALETIDVGLQSGHPLANGSSVGGILLVRSQPEWVVFWVEHHSSVTQPPPLPAVDFSRDAVVAAFAGWRGTTGYSMAVHAVRPAATATGEGVIVDTVETVPGPGCSVNTSWITRPSHVVKVPVALLSGTEVEESRSLAFACR